MRSKASAGRSWALLRLRLACMPFGFAASLQLAEAGSRRGNVMTCFFTPCVHSADAPAAEVLLQWLTCSIGSCARQATRPSSETCCSPIRASCCRRLPMTAMPTRLLLRSFPAAKASSRSVCSFDHALLQTCDDLGLCTRWTACVNHNVCETFGSQIQSGCMSAVAKMFKCVCSSGTDPRPSHRQEGCGCS